MFQLDPKNFLSTGLKQIEDGLNYVLQVAQTAGATRADSGLGTPVLMTMGATSIVWGFPTGLVGTFIVLDHGFVLRRDQYTVDYANQQITLNYLPAQPYALSVAWSASKGGITPPVSLINVVTQGSQFWNLPPDAGVNILVFDTGRILRGDEYTYHNGIVRLTYAPTAPYDISASWGAGGPGISVPASLPPLNNQVGNRVFMLPYEHGTSVVVFDHGLMLNASDYTVDLQAGQVTLAYNPSQPLDIAASWGYPMSGVYFEDIVPSPPADGITKLFVLPQEPVVDTTRLKAELMDGTIQTYALARDFTITGRRVDFVTAPPAGSTLLASMMAVILEEPLSVDKVNGMEAIPATAPGVGTSAQGGKLVGTDASGHLPASILPFAKTRYDNPFAGLPQVFDTVPGLDPNGRLANIFMPINPVLGTTNESVTTQYGVEIDQSTLTEQFVYNPDTTLGQINFMDGSTVVKTAAFAYHPDGTLNTIIEMAGGKTLIRTFNYDANGNVVSVANSLS